MEKLQEFLKRDVFVANGFHITILTVLIVVTIIYVLRRR